jgi:serine/threonine protein kinase/predicted Zn-dependent protease
VVKTKSRRACPVCGTLVPDDSESCPVCALQGALKSHSDSRSDVSSELRFEHYTVLQNADGTPIELGRGAMGVTYKAFDVHLQCQVALKIINARLIGDSSARLRFVREARAAASVRHQNVASVFHLGESGGNFFYAMEFVPGETLGKLIQRNGRLAPSPALDIVEQVASGLTAIQKQHLVHRDIKPSNIMVGLEEGRLESVKIIDLGLAKGAAEEHSISTLGSFVGTPEYASPEQFAGIAADIRSDLYSLGITLWEMLSGKLPFQGSSAELMYQHLHTAPPIGRLSDVPAPVITLLEVLLAKDPGQRFQSPTELQKASPKVKEALVSGASLSAKDLRSDVQVGRQCVNRKPRKHTIRWLIASGLCLGLMLSWFFFSGNRERLFNQRSAEATSTEKSIAVLPFESISANKDDSYFADGVQDEILANVARISQLKVISRTSVMQYRAGEKRDLRQIAAALGVANVLEGAVRRSGNRVRITIELVDAGTDHTVWSEIYDRDLTDIFTIQSEVAQIIASKLTVTLSPAEKRRIESKPTDNLEAYDLYLRAKEQIVSAKVSYTVATTEKPLRDAVSFLEQAIRLDPKFTLAFCASAEAHDLLYPLIDFKPEQRALGDAAVNSALGLQPDMPEVHLAYAYHLYRGYHDYERARTQLAIARRGLPNDSEAIALEAIMDRRQGNFDKAIQELNDAITRDPRNAVPITVLANAFLETRQFRAAKQTYDRLIELLPDWPMFKVLKAAVTYLETGEAIALQSAIAALPSSMFNDRDVLFWRLGLALDQRDWPRVKEFLEKAKGAGDEDGLAGCYSVLIARLQNEQTGGANSGFAKHREQLSQKVQTSPRNANLLCRLAMVDAWLDDKEVAISEAKRAVEMLPISKDAVEGPDIAVNLATVYAWTNELDLAFETLGSLTKTPNGIYYGQLKLDPRWDPLRADPRFDKLLAELAPKD